MVPISARAKANAASLSHCTNSYLLFTGSEGMTPNSNINYNIPFRPTESFIPFVGIHTISSLCKEGSPFQNTLYIRHKRAWYRSRLPMAVGTSASDSYNSIPLAIVRSWNNPDVTPDSPSFLIRFGWPTYRGLPQSKKANQMSLAHLDLIQIALLK